MPLESDNLLQVLLEAMPLPVAWTDRQGRVEYWNPRFSEIFGYPRGEFATVDEWFRRVCPDDAYREKVVAAWRGAAGSAGRDPGTRAPFEYDVTCRDGTVRTVEVFRVLVGDRVLSVFNDVTGRRRAESELARYRDHLESLVTERTAEVAETRRQVEESNLRLRFLFEQAGDMILILDQQARILDVNPQGCREHGFTREEMLARSIPDLNPRFKALDNERWFWETLPVGQSVQFEVEHFHKDGHTIPYEICLSRLDWRGGVFLIALGRNLTERKKAERELLRAKEAAEAADRLKSVFLANMSHELRTPLNVVLGFAQLMRSDPQVPPGQKEKLDVIERSGKHLLGLINDVLDMSRIEAGQVALDHEAFDLWAMLQAVGEVMQLRARAKGLKVLLERTFTVPRYVLGDEKKLKQILINLAGNAVKFTVAGSVTLRARADEGSRVLHFEVEDTGPGIAAEDVPRLFDSFVQVGRNREGVGLGLFISRRLTELMGGSLEVRSTPGVGSVFTCRVPCEPALAADVGPREARRRVIGLAAGQKSPRVLVAEDIPESREFLTRMLRQTGFEVVEASDGREAVQGFERDLPDLVLLDMRMPVMDGDEVLRRIKATERGKRTPVFAVTASALDDERRRILAAGADDFVGKPVQMGELFEAMGRHLGLAYVYEATDAAEPPVDEAGLKRMVADLGGELAGRLRLAVTVMDLEELRALLPAVLERAPALGRRLTALADDYELSELGKLFETEEGA